MRTYIKVSRHWSSIVWTLKSSVTNRFQCGEQYLTTSFRYVYAYVCLLYLVCWQPFNDFTRMSMSLNRLKNIFYIPSVYFSSLIMRFSHVKVILSILHWFVRVTSLYLFEKRTHHTFRVSLVRCLCKPNNVESQIYRSCSLSHHMFKQDFPIQWNITEYIIVS
jgi:hypothetical protein